MYFDTEESAEELLLSNGFLLIVKGDRRKNWQECDNSR